MIDMNRHTEQPPLFAGFTQPESNYFRIPNEWINVCAAIESLAELKVILYVLRHTWGYQEYGITKTISVDEFMEGRKRQDGTRMDKGTGLSERSVKEGIKRAIKDGYLVCEIDTSDKARIKKSYALKMTPEEIRASNTLSTNGGIQSTPLQGDTIYPSGGKILPLRQEESTPRSEKDTRERHLEKESDCASSHDVPTPTPLFPETPQATSDIPIVTATGKTTRRAKQETPEPVLTDEEQAARAALLTKTRAIQAKINQWRGYDLDEKVDKIREREAVKTLASKYTLEQIDYVYTYLTTKDKYWSLPENKDRIGGLTLVKETAKIIAKIKEKEQRAKKSESPPEPVDYSRYVTPAMQKIRDREARFLEKQEAKKG